MRKKKQKTKNLRNARGLDYDLDVKPKSSVQGGGWKS